MTSDTYAPAALLDLDGTLVDSVFHHVVTWGEAFHAAGYDVPLWRIHAGIGMGSERLVPWLLGRRPDDLADLTDDHKRRFLEHADDLHPTAGALELLDDLEQRGIAFLIATSANTAERKALLAALGREDMKTADADDVGSSKPAPDLLLAACATLGVDPSAATLVGDSPWDAEAARRVGIRSIGVRCGGFGDDRMLAAGAEDVVDDPRALIGRL
ncbi:HAD family hydrolase [soil metagenome]|jgi:HAD superfamily hydrolase (TIGR01509 family)